MPVTIKPSTNIARANRDVKGETRAIDLFQSSCPREYRRCNELIQSSFPDLADRDATITPESNGLFAACHSAYSNHYHLILRPEDIWFAILSQLSFYINAHAEELRSFFVAHEGQKELTVVGPGDIFSADFGAMAVRMTKEIQKNVVDPDLCDWIMPDFSTTTRDDTVTAAILMMGSLQKYFTYRMKTRCGLPSVTLLGEKHDWEKIRRRLDTLERLGDEPKKFGSLLKPILNNFIHSFDKPDHPDTKDFWSRIIHRESGGSGRPAFYTGWISAFVFWSCDGKQVLEKNSLRGGLGDLAQKIIPSGAGSGLDISGILKYRVETSAVPSGSTSVPVTVDDGGTIYKTRMVAGLVGTQWSRSGGPFEEPPYQSLQHRESASTELRTPLDTVQPLSGWWMYEVSEAAEKEEEKGRDIMKGSQYMVGKNGDLRLGHEVEYPKNERGVDKVPFWHLPRVEVVEVEV